MIVETDILKAIMILKNSFIENDEGMVFACTDDVIKALEILEGSHK